MALRFFLTNSAAPYTPATIRGTWSDKALTGASAMQRRKVGAGATQAKAETSNSSSWSVLCRRFVSEPANNPGTVSGAFSLCAGWLENNADASMTMQLYMYVIAGDSDTVRGALTTTLAGGTEFPVVGFGTNAAGRLVTGTASSVDILPGDRVVLEIGFKAGNTTTSSRTGTFYYGGTAADLESGNQNVTTRPGWVDFSDESFHDAWDIPFRSGDTTTTMDVTVNNDQAGKLKTASTTDTPAPTVTATQGYKVVKTIIDSVRPPGRPPGHPPDPELGSFTTGIRYQGSDTTDSAHLDYTGSTAKRIPSTTAESLHTADPKMVPYALLQGDHDISPPDVELLTAPPAARPQEPVRFMAQDIRTDRWLNWDLPLIDVSITWNLSGPTLLQAKLHPESPTLRELGISAWATWIHIEQGGRLLGSVIWQPTKIDGEEYTVEGVGFSGYAQGTPFFGEDQFITRDACDVMRRIWIHLESYPDCKIGVTVSNAMSGLLLGIPPMQAVDETGEPQFEEPGTEIQPPDPNTTIDTQEELEITNYVQDPDTGILTVWYNDGAIYTFIPKIDPPVPYVISWYSDTDCGQEFDNLARTARVEYRETTTWGTDDTTIIPRSKRQIELGYPRIGSKRFELRCAQDENMLVAIPLEEATGTQGYASQIMAKGVGDGRDAVRGFASQADPKRIRRVAIVHDGTLTMPDQATLYAQDELLRRRAAITVGQAVVMDWHPNMPFGSYSVGDEILVTGFVPWAGYIEFWHRIIAYVWEPGKNIVTLTIRRAEQFGYGAPLPDPQPEPVYPWPDGWESSPIFDYENPVDVAGDGIDPLPQTPVT